MFYNIINKILKNYRYNSENDIDIDNIKIILKNDINSVLIDVRSPQEYKEGHLDNSINIPVYDITKEIRKKVIDNENTIIVYCQTGNRSIRAIKILSKMGYKNLYNLKGRTRQYINNCALGTFPFAASVPFATFYSFILLKPDMFCINYNLYIL